MLCHWPQQAMIQRLKGHRRLTVAYVPDGRKNETWSRPDERGLLSMRSMAKEQRNLSKQSQH